jgi:hypothetical protein
LTPAAEAVCGLMDMRLISDLGKDEAAQTNAVYGIGANGDPAAGLQRVVATPWFDAVQDLDLFRATNLKRYEGLTDADEYPDRWFWETEQATACVGGRKASGAGPGWTQWRPAARRMTRSNAHDGSARFMTAISFVLRVTG